MAVQPATIDDYLARLSDEKRVALEKIRRAIRAVAPAAEEKATLADVLQEMMLAESRDV